MERTTQPAAGGSRRRTFVFVALSIIFTYLGATASEPISWPSGKSAAAWRTKKTMFLFKSVEPIGLNTELRITVAKSGTARLVTVEIPIDKFDSGEPMRDKDVRKILHSDIQPNLLFKSVELTETQWQQVLNGELPVLKGSLAIGGISFPEEFAIQVKGTGADQFIEGQLETSFTAFKLTPPSIAGGLISKVKDELYLHFRIYAKDVTGI